MMINIKQIFNKLKEHISNKTLKLNVFSLVCTLLCIIMICSGVVMEKWGISVVFTIALLVFVESMSLRLLCTNEKYEKILLQNRENTIKILNYNQNEEINNKYREMVHNMSHFLKVIKCLAYQNKCNDIYSLVNETDERFENYIVKQYSDNNIINMLIAQSKACAREKNIEFEVYVEPGINFEHIAATDMISMLGNLLDNAITAASKKDKNSSVNLKIFKPTNNSDICIIKISNDYDKILVDKNGKLITTKKDKLVHGIGISSVKKIAKKYNGYMEYFIEEERFITVVVLSSK